MPFGIVTPIRDCSRVIVRKIDVNCLAAYNFYDSCKGPRAGNGVRPEYIVYTEFGLKRGEAKVTH